MQISQTPADYTPQAEALKDKVIAVTGAGDGIGRAAALAYAGLGATVILIGRTVAKLEAVYDEIEANGGPQAAIYPLDLASCDEAKAIECAEALGDEFSQLDGLLHNAGVLGDRRPIESAGYDAWLEVMQVNVNAGFLLTRYLLPLLGNAPSASIIFTSSSVGRVGRAFWGAYSVSKFATEGLMQVLAAETQSTTNIRVNSLNPGATNTAMRRSAYPGEDPNTNPTAADIMATYVYLMDDASDEITGQTFNAQ